MSVIDMIGAPDKCLQLCCRISMVGVAISSLEFLSLRNEFKRGGVFDWGVLRTCYFATLNNAHTTTRLYNNFSDKVVSHNWFAPLMLLARFLGSICYLIVSDPLVSASSLFVVLGTTLLLHWRCAFGLDGSDQMGLVVICSTALCQIELHNTSLSEWGLWFIALQSCLAYVTAGSVKFISPSWRSGRAISGIFGTRTFGLWRVGEWLEAQPLWCKVIAWSVFIPECTFVLVLWGNIKITFAFIVWGIIFHASISLIMGLNVFTWSFIATYPAIIYCARLVQHCRFGTD